MLLMQATMFLAQPNRARLLVLLEPLAARPARVRVQTLLQDILCHLLVSRVRLHAVLVTIKHHLVKHPAMLLMLATMFLAQPKAARLLVLLEHTIQTLGPRVPRLVEMLMQDTMYPQQVNPVKPHAVLVTIRHLPGRLPVMLLMQATMFLAQPKRARLLVLLEHATGRACVLTHAGYIVSLGPRATACSPIKQSSGQTSCEMLMQATMFLVSPNEPDCLCCWNIQSKHWFWTVSGRCLESIVGYYVPTAQTSQTACAAGTYQASTGQSSCDDADAGHSSNIGPSEPDRLCCRNVPIEHWPSALPLDIMFHPPANAAR